MYGNGHDPTLYGYIRCHGVTTCPSSARDPPKWRYTGVVTRARSVTDMHGSMHLHVNLMVGFRQFAIRRSLFFRRLRGALWPDGPLRAATTLDRAISLIWRRLMSFCIRGNPSSMRHIKSWQHSSQLNSRHLVHTPMIKSALRHLSTCKARANDTDTDPSPTTQLTHQHRKANMQTRSNLVRV